MANNSVVSLELQLCFVNFIHCLYDKAMHIRGSDYSIACFGALTYRRPYT